MMACVSNMDLEPRFLGMFGQVASWEIPGETLQLLDANRKPLATFESRYRSSAAKGASRPNYFFGPSRQR